MTQKQQWQECVSHFCSVTSTKSKVCKSCCKSEWLQQLEGTVRFRITLVNTSGKQVAKWNICFSRVQMYLCQILCIFREASKFNSLNLGYYFYKMGKPPTQNIKYKLLLLNFIYSSTECSNMNASKLVHPYNHLFSLWILLKYSIAPFSKFTLWFRTCLLCQIHVNGGGGVGQTIN